MKKVLIFLLVSAGVFAAWFWFKSSNAPVAEEASERPVASVETAVLVDQPIAQTIEVFGVMVAAPSGDHVTSAPYDCVVRRIYVGVGTPVAAGEVLLDVEPSPEAKLAADSARSLLVLSTKSLAATQQRYDLKLATNLELITAQQVADDAQLKADSFAARGLGGDGRITAPAAGVVTHLDLFAGALAPTGTALVTVSTGGQMEARLGIEAAEVGVVASGQTVTLQSSQRANAEAVTATVRSVGAALDPTTGTAEVRAPVPTGAPLLFGEHVRAQIQVLQKDHALLVPRSAVLPDDEKNVLFTVNNGQAVRHEVKTGLATDDLIEVSGEGLQAGDIVVTLGNYELEDGMTVQLPEKEKAAGKPEQEAKP